jgi:hypothetical protein
LIDAANGGWKDVEPAIFGTLLERALEPTERHKLGAHFTPKAYVERLVMPTIIEPLTDEWRSVEAAALAADNAGKKDEAIATIKAFLRKLCDTKVLDPACGTGNFLYVTMEHMKRLEGEIWDRLRGLGETQTFEGFGLTVDPHQFLGIEINPRAAAIADLVLWIGYLRWHLRTFGGPPKEPILRKYENIECRDAILAYDRAAPLLDDEDNHVTRWDRVSMKKHPVTGKDVPDDSQRLQVLEYMNPKKTEWPPADFIVGNPPYIGVRQLRTSVGDPYVRALAVAYPEIPETSDYVMYWWDKAARAIASGQTRQFGLITTNSIVQAYSRRLLESHIGDKGAIKLAFAIADHPWVDAADGAAVRVALTVGCAASDQGNAVLGAVQGDEENSPVMLRTVDRIGSSLDEASVHERIETLLANRDTCFQGVVPAGEGFKLDSLELKSLGFSESTMHRVIRPYIIGKDLVQIPRKRYIIDFFGMSKDEARLSAPTLFQRLLDHVYPDRARNNRATYRDRWWLFAEPRPGLRRAVKGLSRFIVTPYTAKFRPFIFVSTETLPDAMAYAVASDDAFILGVLSSLAHSAWSRMTGGTLENRPRYNSDATFLPFPFPISGVKNQARIRTLAEQLDAHRKARQSEHPTLTLTGMYNVLEKLRNGEPLTAKERTIHDQGLISVLKQIHDDLDAAVFDAYGWPHNLTHDQILERLVALNHERAAEEKRGLIRWLRPEFQNPTDKSATASSTQTALPMEPTDEPATAAKPRRKANGKTPWPTTPTEQAQTIREALAAIGPATPEQIARTFHRANKSKVKELLSAMATLGQVRELRDGNFSLNSPAGSISTQLKENS